MKSSLQAEILLDAGRCCFSGGSTTVVAMVQRLRQAREPKPRDFGIRQSYFDGFRPFLRAVKAALSSHCAGDRGFAP